MRAPRRVEGGDLHSPSVHWAPGIAGGTDLSPLPEKKRNRGGGCDGSVCRE